MSTDFATAKAYLARNEGGNSVFNHLSNVLLKLAAENPADALRAFEKHSTGIQQSTFIPGAGEGTATKGQGVEIAKSKASTWATETTALYRNAKRHAAVKAFSPAVRSLEWAGVGVDAEEADRIDRALNALASVEDVKSLRFWGRLQGTSADYFVIEGQPSGYPEQKDSPTEESGPLGANRYTYWVALQIGGAESWTKLGPATTEQLRLAPLVRRYVTGDLNAPVGGHPAFPGNEAAYVRAIIAHITASASVCPADLFVAGEADDTDDFLSQENDIRVAEEPATDLDAIAEVGGWCHIAPGINAAGRAKNYVPREWDEEEKAFQPNPPEEAEEELPALRELDEGDEDSPSWSVCGAGKQRAIKSNLWPGAVAVASENSFTNYYSGFGVPRATKTQYAPRFPGRLSIEFDIGELKEAADVTEKPPEPEAEDEEQDE